MKNLSEPTYKNVLRQPLVLGVPFEGLIALTGLVTSIEVLGQGAVYGTYSAGIVAVMGFATLRLFARYSKTGWEESFISRVEQIIQGPIPIPLVLTPSRIDVVAPDTLDEVDLLLLRSTLRERVDALKPGERLTLLGDMTPCGFLLLECSRQEGAVRNNINWNRLTHGHLSKRPRVYSLHQLPVSTDPLWLTSVLRRLPPHFQIAVTLQGEDYSKTKNQIEGSRKRNSQIPGLSNVDSEVTFHEATSVLYGLSRGDESIVTLSLVITSQVGLSLDPQVFVEERQPDLALSSIFGFRKRLHRRHTVRSLTAVDLIPRLLDSRYEENPIFHTLRSIPMGFDPLDSRLEALHWLVVGASGSGKSFFTGLVLKRLLENGRKFSVLFLDHNRSFRRIIRAQDDLYAEPQNLREVQTDLKKVLATLNEPGMMGGIELSDLSLDEKKEALHFTLSQVESFLRSRTSFHPVYVVIDECWNFLRDEPLLVQRAFREFRKLNGAAIAITQSLTDFLQDETGSSVFQNAPVRILLRQGEDLTSYRGQLGLNDVELGKVRLLRQEKGAFSECLIKTPFLSRIARLYPTPEEHELLRTDNLREEIIAEMQIKKEAQ